jgi:hypothetical protein
MAKPTPETALEQARRDLERALRTGADTTAARAAVESAEAALAESGQIAAARQAETAQEKRARIDAEVRGMVNQAREAIQTEVSAILPGFDISIQIDPLPALRLVTAREQHQEAEEQRFALLDELSILAGRIDALEAERNEIVQRRRAGQRDDIRDAGRIGLIDIDLADLRTMAERCRNDLDAMPGNDLPALVRAWDASVASARSGAKLALCQELERRLWFVAKSLRDEAGGSIQRRWRPAPEFRMAVQQGVV